MDQAPVQGAGTVTETGSVGRMPEEWKPYMSREDFELLWKLYLGGYTYRELCLELGVKKSALGMRVRRIKERFQKNYRNF